MSANPRPTPVHLLELAPADRQEWLARMEASFTAGVKDAGLREGEQPIPTATEMAELLTDPDRESLQISDGGEIVGGAIVSRLDRGRRTLDLFFMDAGRHGAGVGARAWDAIEARYPDTEVWETETPLFDERNIHFYINRCGFAAVEFFHPGHRPEAESDHHGDDHGPDRMLRFEKRMRPSR